MRPLSVVIPTLNESRSLPLLLADLARWPWSMQLLVVDGSRDATVNVAHLAEAEVSAVLNVAGANSCASAAPTHVKAGFWCFMPTAVHPYGLKPSQR